MPPSGTKPPERQWRFIRNDIAAEDVPVGFLCSGLGGLGLAESIGTGGFNGFTTGLTEADSVQLRYLPGGHGYAFEEKLDSIARWLTAEHPSVAPEEESALGLVGKRTGLLPLLSRMAPVIVLVVMLVFVYLILIGGHPFLAILELLVLLWLLSII